MMGIRTALLRLDSVVRAKNIASRPLGQVLPSPRMLNRLGFFAFIALFLGVLGYFNLGDTYHRHFFQASAKAYLPYYLCRCLLLAYLTWFLCFVGRCIIYRLDRSGTAFSLGLVESLLLAFFVGAAAVSFAIFGLGFLNLYYKWLAALIVGIVLALSYSDFFVLARRAWNETKLTFWNDRNPLRLGVCWTMTAIFLASAGLLLVAKGLFPGGGGDYYTHYFGYFKQVVQSHGLWPNDVWYHFYISKGNTIVFLGILLSDALAPEIITFGFVLASALALGCLIQRFTTSFAWPLAGMTAFLCALVYTPADHFYPEWGLFQKHHEFTLSLLSSVTWLMVIMPRAADPSTERAWKIALCLLVGHLVLFAPTTTPLVIGALAINWTVSRLITRQRLVARCCFWGCAAAATVFISLMALNYAVTGMAEITPFRPFWKFANQERFSQQVSPYLMVLLEQGSLPSMGDFTSVDLSGTTVIEYYWRLLRLFAAANFFPWRIIFLSLAAIISIQLLRGRRTSIGFWNAAAPIGGLLITALLLTRIVNQPVSTYRYYSFLLFYVVAGAVLTWCWSFQLLPSRRLVGATGYILPCLIGFIILRQSWYSMPSSERHHIARFATCRLSLAEGYQTHQNGVTMSIVDMRDHMPPGARLYGFNCNNYCMAPGCDYESFVSYSLGKNWHVIMFEPANVAREELQRQGLNYFAIEPDNLVIDILQYSPLFQWDQIEHNLEVAWTDGDSYLLTWPGPNTTPIPCEFLGRYRDGYANPFDLEPLYERVKLIYEQNKGKSYPVYTDPSLPPVKGWQ